MIAGTCPWCGEKFFEGLSLSELTPIKDDKLDAMENGLLAMGDDWFVTQRAKFRSGETRALHLIQLACYSMLKELLSRSEEVGGTPSTIVQSGRVDPRLLDALEIVGEIALSYEGADVKEFWELVRQKLIDRWQQGSTAP